MRIEAIQFLSHCTPLPSISGASLLLVAPRAHHARKCKPRTAPSGRKKWLATPLFALPFIELWGKEESGKYAP